MERLYKVALICLFALVDFNTSALVPGDSVQVAESSVQYDWNPIMNAVIQVESGGDRYAKSGSSVGVMQITPICVADCNRILRRKKSKKRFKLSDRFSIAKSKEMFLIIQSYYNPLNDIERAIRLWNGGVNYGVKHTQHYFEKVMHAMNLNLISK